MNDIVSLFPVDSCFQFNFAYRKQIPLTWDMARAFTSGPHFCFFRNNLAPENTLEMIQFKEQIGPITLILWLLNQLFFHSKNTF